MCFLGAGLIPVCLYEINELLDLIKWSGASRCLVAPSSRVLVQITAKKENHLCRWFSFLEREKGLIRRQSPVLGHGLSPHPTGLSPWDESS